MNTQDEYHYLNSPKKEDLAHQFNLRDRKKICYNKKYGGFVYYKNGDEVDEANKLSELEEAGSEVIQDKQQIINKRNV